MTQTFIDLETQVAALTKRLGDARRTRARADAEVDAARASHDHALSMLTQEFGVSTAEQARAKLDELQTALAAEIDALTQALNTMEGQG